MDVPVFLVCVGDVRVRGVGATRKGKTRELTGKPSMQEGGWKAMGGSPLRMTMDVNERTLG